MTTRARRRDDRLRPSPTTRQLEVLKVIDELSRRSGYAPSIRELGDALDISSTHGVHCHLVSLERHGWVARVEGTARTLLLTTQGAAWVATRRAA